MPHENGRMPPAGAQVDDGWVLKRLTEPSRLFGANGIRTGTDGRIYVAQVAGSQISAIDPDSGLIDTISPFGGDIIGPDDLVFDEVGNLYVTELTEGRVCMRAPNGTVSIIQGDMPVANPITYHQGRLIAGECRPGARIMELDRNGGAPRIILDNVPMANAFEVGPDGKLYFPVMGTNEIWRVDLAGGPPEIVAGDLGVPDSVKFDSKGFIVSTQVASGQVLRIDPRSGERTVLADIQPGMDNCTFVGDRLFVSNMVGSIDEIIAPGEVRPLVKKGLQWPMGIAVGDGGLIYVADGAFGYTFRPGEPLHLVGMLFSPGYPGFTRGVAAGADGSWITGTANGEVKRYRPNDQASEEIASGLDRVMGIAVSARGAVLFAEYGTGRLLSAENGTVVTLASGLDRPAGVAIDRNGVAYVAESGAGRIVKVESGRSSILADGLQQPEGIALVGDTLFVIDVGAKALLSMPLRGGSVKVLASSLPVGAPPGTERKYLGAVGILSGPMNAFCGLAAAPDGSLCFAADGEGSVMALSPKAV
ncbi:MAG TPA: gluconolaconase [Sphingobium sp.]|uniref:gluconolaconase n=1 Tax=Sphingobium sp. TaxID=1912891 RepID=UPI002ED39949